MRKRIKVPAIMGAMNEFPPGTPERAQIRAALFQSQWQNMQSLDARSIEKYCGDEFITERAWTLYDPVGTKKLRDWVEAITGDAFEVVVRCIAGFHPEIAKQWKIIAEAEENELAKHGEIGNGRKGESRVRNTKSTGSDTATYVARRLLRDHPAVYQEWKAGKISANAAAVKVGIRKKPSPAEVCVKAFRKAENRLEPLRLIVDSLEPFEAAIVRDWVVEKLN